MTKGMSLRLLLIVSAALIATAVAPASAANLLVNPGFDDAADAPCVGGSNGSTGTTYNWTWVFPAGYAYLWRETDRAVPYYHGIQACHHSSGISGTTGDAEAKMYQDVWVEPNSQYTASVNVYGVAGLDPVNYPGIGFGSASTDTAGLRITEFNSTGGLVLEHPKVELKTATTDWYPISETFTTQSATRLVRFSCETKIACHWTIGRVVYDDCVLDGPAGSAPVATVSGTVTTGIAPNPVTPVAGATITIGATSVTTDSNGNYTIGNLAAFSSVKVNASKDGFFCENKYRTSLPEGNTVVDFNLVPAAANNLIRNPGFETNIYEHGANETSPHLSQNWWCQHMYSGTYIAYETEGVRAPGFQHCGKDAATIATSTDGASGTVLMYQDVQVVPGANYRAGLWVKGYGTFGANGTDKTGLWVQELAKDDSLVMDHGLMTINTATQDFEFKHVEFAANAQTFKVRFLVYTEVGCGWWLGRAIIDDAFLDGPAPPTAISGMVTQWMGNGAPAGPGIEGASVSVIGSTGTVYGTATTDADGYYQVLLDDTHIGKTRWARVTSPDYQTERQSVVVFQGTNTANFSVWAKGDNRVANPSFEDTFNDAGDWKMEDTGFQNETWAAQYNVPFYYQGRQAAQTVPGSGGGTYHGMYQIVPVVGGENYTARAQFHGFGPTGFSEPLDPVSGLRNLSIGQYAFLYVKEYDPFGTLLAEQGPVFAWSLGWEPLEIPFTANANTRYVRIGVRARIIDSSWAHLGRAVFDCFELNGPQSPPVPSLNGLVKSNGVPLEGAKVEVVGSGLSTTSDSTGYWELSPPLNTNVWVRASKDGYFAQRFYRGTPGSAQFDLVPVGSNLMSNPGFDDGRTGSGWLQSGDGVNRFVYESDQAEPKNYQSGEEAGDVVKY